VRSIEDEARLAPVQPLTRLAASSCTSCRRRTKIARVAGAKFASRAPRCCIARARDRVVTRIVSGFALPRTLQSRSPRASPRRSRHASRVSPSRGWSTNGKMAAKPLPQPRSRFHVERLREVWDKVNPEGAGALSYAALKRTLDDLEIDWVRTARPSLRAARRVAPRRQHLSPISPPP